MTKEEYKNSKIVKKQEIKSLNKEYKINVKKIKEELKNQKQQYKKTKEKRLTQKQLKKQEKKLKNIIKNQPPKLRIIEEIGNAITHGLGALFAIIAFLLMLNKSKTSIQVFSAIIYSCSLFILFVMSSMYHSFKYGSVVKRIFRRFDYSSIYLLIGGTFAPILLIFLNNRLGYAVFLIQWFCIIVGITMLGVFGPGRLKWLHFPLYFILGWIGGVCIIPAMLRNNLQLFYWILSGGIVYTIGMIPFCIKGRSAHFIWHIIVLIAAILQFIGIYLYLY